jgi:hypothetical protein
LLYAKKHKYEQWLKAMMKAVVDITEKDSELFQEFVKAFNRHKGE